jgi:hypothetical protein
MTTDRDGFDWDIFISYPRVDREWVRGELESALRARGFAGRPPRIFVDVGTEGLKSGAHWLESLADAVERSKFFVPVYSRAYFASRNCRQELNWAMWCHAADERLLPIARDPAVEIPFAYSQIHCLSTVDTIDWLDRLCDQIGLSVLSDRSDRPVLRFGDTPDRVTVNHTLPELRITLVSEHTGRCARDGEQVTLSAEPASARLGGTLKMTSQGGTTIFRDLSFAAAAEEVRLVAEWSGGTVRSDPFPVRQPVTGTPDPAPQPGHEPASAVFFLDDDRAVATLSRDGRLSVCRMRDGALDACPVADAGLEDVPRLWARWGRYAVVAGWSGRLALAGVDGGTRALRLGPSGDGQAVPGALCPLRDRLLVGMWDGTVWVVDPDGVASKFVHPDGIQAMAGVDGQLLVADLRGILKWYSPTGRALDRPVHPLESSLVWALWARPDCVVTICPDRVYRLDPESNRPVALPLPREVNAATGALAEGDLAAVFGASGQGVQLTSHLAVRNGFRCAPGHRPISSDASGKLMVTASEDGAHALIYKGRVVLMDPAGPLGVSSDGTLLARCSGGPVTVEPLRPLLDRA